MIDKIMQVLETIEYGFKDENGVNIHDNEEKWDKEFEDFYYLLSPEELLEKRCGTCWEQVELERKLFQDININSETFFICTYGIDAAPCHTFLVYESNNNFYWFEHSWYDYKGIHEYPSLEELLLDVKFKFIKSNKDVEGMTFITRYKRPPYHLKCSEMYEYMEHQELLRLNMEDKYFVYLYNNEYCTVKTLRDLNLIDKYHDYDDYVICFKEEQAFINLDKREINVSDEYLEKKMLDIITDNNVKLIKFIDE